VAEQTDGDLGTCSDREAGKVDPGNAMACGEDRRMRHSLRSGRRGMDVFEGRRTATTSSSSAGPRRSSLQSSPRKRRGAPALWRSDPFAIYEPSGRLDLLQNVCYEVVSIVVLVSGARLSVDADRYIDQTRKGAAELCCVKKIFMLRPETPTSSLSWRTGGPAVERAVEATPLKYSGGDAGEFEAYPLAGLRR